jgi:hypothetical protein
MTTSFCHFAHGDLVSSLHANPAGTLLAAVGIVLVPWLVVSACWGRRLGVRDYEICLTKGVICLLVLLIVNWAIIASWCWWSRI